MPRFRSPYVRSVLASAVMLVLTLATAGCASSGQTTTTTTSATGTTPFATHPSNSTATSVPVTPTTAPVPFKAGGISFIGPVKSVTSSSMTMSAPDGRIYTLSITAQADLSALGGARPTLGASLNMDAVVNPGGSFTATILKPAQPGDPDTNVIAYTGITTSAVGADRVIHFTVGTTSYTFPIPATADLTDFAGNAQAIGINVSVQVKIQYEKSFPCL